MSKSSSDQSSSQSRRRAIKSILGVGALLPCASALALKSGVSAPEPNKNFHVKVEDLVNRSRANIDRLINFTLTPEDLPWTQTLGQLTAGQSVTFLLNGRWWIVKEMDLWVEPGVAFHARIDGGHSYNPMNNSGTMLADRSGVLEIARSVGEFSNPRGELFTPPEHYTAAQGSIEGVAIVWQDDPLQGLIQLSAAGDVEGLVSAEIKRLSHESSLPAGWHYMYMFGDGGIFTGNHEGHIDCNTHKDVGILQYPIEMPLEKGLGISWQWLVEQLPADVAEDAVLSHDYLSIAVEFDDGKDITYMWSSSLPEGKVFQCPLPRWSEIETHVVQRSGATELGKELKEQRDLYSDYQQYIGGSATQVTRIWLIANSVFLRSSGRCSYSDIALQSGSKIVKVL
ncbi:DUF3047 domain-containing protein [Amphritea atlantica]|uniref:DUF3047 domain-containing protein n=1 Tax=Amphritea atlantica TaxID=355243 RepID=A0ABY5GZH6_9GAMM|nr:DUF3047 domain-containing protein [Amphritea atlantica]